jgi:hypothetical protein
MPYEAAALEARQREGDGRLRESRGADELAAREGISAAQAFEEELLVQRPDEAWPRGATLLIVLRHLLASLIKIG